jgi:hypothetical protein
LRDRPHFEKNCNKICTNVINENGEGKRVLKRGIILSKFIFALIEKKKSQMEMIF